jgi:hypothetical protein
VMAVGLEAAMVGEKDLDVFCGKGGSDYHVMRQRLLEAHTTIYGLCFAYILEITRVRLGHNIESSRVTIRRPSGIQT